MTSDVEMEKMFMYWTQDGKWSGMMGVEWLFIKDVPFKEFKSIEIMMKYNNILKKRDGQRKPVFNSRDTQEVPLKESISMMETIERYLNTNTILEHFEYYDMRQENYEKNHSSDQGGHIKNI